MLIALFCIERDKRVPCRAFLVILRQFCSSNIVLNRELYAVGPGGRALAGAILSAEAILCVCVCVPPFEQSWSARGLPESKYFASVCWINAQGVLTKNWIITLKISWFRCVDFCVGKAPLVVENGDRAKQATEPHEAEGESASTQSGKTKSCGWSP